MYGLVAASANPLPECKSVLCAMFVTRAKCLEKNLTKLVICQFPLLRTRGKCWLLIGLTQRMELTISRLIAGKEPGAGWEAVIGLGGLRW